MQTYLVLVELFALSGYGLPMTLSEIQSTVINEKSVLKVLTLPER